MLAVQVKPGAKAPGIVLGAEGEIVVRVREPAIEGRATQAARASLARALGISQSRVTLARGATSRRKSFSIDGLTAEDARSRIANVARASRSS